ncbi:hypothetical protein QN382_19840 [Pseudomonas sp. 10B1]|uniref:hypothetical protein n=1 Tax=Pseudomonas sp. 10B1 TaxID=3048573 RepID=UPI002B236669|nr:hypothetical protein [Pseudomonas sp. 10B1]MEB0311529.1 hypothetical protein [Pseudomonas sp. 10B1]
MSIPPKCKHDRNFCFECHGSNQADCRLAQYTCIGKGGKYTDIGVAIGAGTCKGELVQVYRDGSNGQMYFRELEDFVERIEFINPEEVA